MRKVEKGSGIGGIRGIGDIGGCFLGDFDGNRGNLKVFSCNCVVEKAMPFFEIGCHGCHFYVGEKVIHILEMASVASVVSEMALRNWRI